MRRFALALLFLIVSASAASAYEARMYGMRGLLGSIYSRGVDTVAARVQSTMDVKTYVRPYGQWRALAATAKANWKIDRKPVILYGHSLGADRITNAAEDLRRSGVPVMLALYYDPTPFVQPVPGNVSRAVEYRQNAFAQLGQGVIDLVAEFTGTSQIFTKRISHVALDDDPGVHNASVCEIRAALSKSPINLCPWLGGALGVPVMSRSSSSVSSGASFTQPAVTPYRQGPEPGG